MRVKVKIYKSLY